MEGGLSGGDGGSDMAAEAHDRTCFPSNTLHSHKSWPEIRHYKYTYAYGF